MAYQFGLMLQSTDQTVGYAVGIGGSLVALALYVVGWGAVLSAGAVALERKRGARWVWSAWLALVASTTAVGTIGSQRYFPGAGSVRWSLYVLTMFVGVPTGAMTLAATRAGRSEVKPTWMRQLAYAFVAFAVAVPVAVLLAALPALSQFIM